MIVGNFVVDGCVVSRSFHSLRCLAFGDRRRRSMKLAKYNGFDVFQEVSGPKFSTSVPPFELLVLRFSKSSLLSMPMPLPKHGVW